MEHALPVIALGAVVAGFVRGLSGLAFGLVAMSISAWAVKPRPDAVLAVVGALTGRVVAAVTVRRGFDVRCLAPLVGGGLLGLPLGLWLLPRLDVPLLKALLVSTPRFSVSTNQSVRLLTGRGERRGK